MNNLSSENTANKIRVSKNQDRLLAFVVVAFCILYIAVLLIPRII